jgi:hypothetical protein
MRLSYFASALIGALALAGSDGAGPELRSRTLFASNNGGSTGDAIVYFDLTVKSRRPRHARSRRNVDVAASTSIAA